MSNRKQAQANKEKQIVHPGPSKELWDEVLARHGLDPEKITEYNVPEEEDSKTLDQLDAEQKDILFETMERCKINPHEFFGVQPDSSRKN